MTATSDNSISFVYTFADDIMTISKESAQFQRSLSTLRSVEHKSSDPIGHEKDSSTCWLESFSVEDTYNTSSVIDAAKHGNESSTSVIGIVSSGTKDRIMDDETETSILTDTTEPALIDTEEEEHTEQYFQNKDTSRKVPKDISFQVKRIKTRFRNRKNKLRKLIPNKDSKMRKYMMEQEKLVNDRVQNSIEWKLKNRLTVSDNGDRDESVSCSPSGVDANLMLRRNASKREVTSETEEAKEEQHDNIGMVFEELRIIDRIKCQALFEWYHTLPSLGAYSLYVLFHTSFYRIFYDLATEVVYSAQNMTYSALIVGIFIIRATGCCYQYFPDTKYYLVKFDVHNKIRLGHLDAKIMRWFSKRRNLKAFMDLAAFYFIFYATDILLNEKMLYPLFDKRDTILKDLPSLQNGTSVTRTQSILALGRLGFEYSEERFARLQEVAKNTNYDDIKEKAECVLNGYVQINHLDDRSDESVKIEANGLEDEENDEVDGEESDELEVEELDDYEEEASDIQRYQNITIEEASLRQDQYEIESTCDDNDDTGLSEYNSLFDTEISVEEVELYSKLSNYLMSEKEYDDDLFLYHHLSQASYFGLVGDPDAIAVSTKSSLIFYSSTCLIALGVLYKLDMLNAIN